MLARSPDLRQSSRRRQREDDRLDRLYESLMWESDIALWALAAIPIVSLIALAIIAATM